MSSLFRREWKLVVGPVDVTKLDFTFSVKRTLSAAANAATVKIFNLSEDSRQKIAAAKKAPLTLAVGYEDGGAGVIFDGSIRHAQTSREGATTVTEVRAGDGAVQIASARIDVSIPAGTSTGDVLTKLAESLGVGRGNVDLVAARLRGRPPIHATATVISGYASDELTHLTRSVGLEWSIQNGALQILEIGQPVLPVAIDLRSSTGLVGSPTSDSNGVVSATSLIHPEIRPGALASITSVAFTGVIRIAAIDYSGGTREHDWYAKISGRRV